MLDVLKMLNQVEGDAKFWQGRCRKEAIEAIRAIGFVRKMIRTYHSETSEIYDEHLRIAQHRCRYAIVDVERIGKDIARAKNASMRELNEMLVAMAQLEGEV